MSAAYGHRAVVERRKAGGGVLETETVEIRRQGSEAAIRRAASLVHGFVRIEELDPFTEEEWLRCFGRGRS